MCLEYSRNRKGCEGTCPLASICTPEDGREHEDEVVKAVESYRAQKAAERGEYAVWVADHCEAECIVCPIGICVQCKVVRDNGKKQ